MLLARIMDQVDATGIRPYAESRVWRRGGLEYTFESDFQEDGHTLRGLNKFIGRIYHMWQYMSIEDTSHETLTTEEGHTYL